MKGWPMRGISMELPPRTRRIQLPVFDDAPDDGTTSAYAENTPGLCPGFLLPWNYLRVRGEYLMA